LDGAKEKRMARLFVAAALAILGAAFAHAEDSKPGDWTAPEVAEHGDWSTSCDNANDCTSVSVSRDFVKRVQSTDPGDYAMPTLWVKRRAGPSARPRVFVDTSTWGQASPLGALTLHVYYDCDGDCTGRAYKLKQVETGRYELAPEQVAAFFAESMKTSRAATRRADGTMHGIITTDGLVAAMRRIDENQERRDTVTAIYAKGKKPASAVPVEKQRPTVRVVRGLNEPSTEMPYHVEVQRIRKQHCTGPYDANETNIQRFRLRNGHNLWSIICANNPHNPTHLWLVETSRDKFEIFKLPRPEQGRPAEMPIQPHSLFDPASGQLSTYHVGEEVGSCGLKRRWAWTGKAFEMIDASEMPACYGIQAHQWLQTYRAIPE
jgi:hypothetical protein